MRLADLVVAEAMRAAGQREVVGRDVDRRTGVAEHLADRAPSAGAARDRRARAPLRRALRTITQRTYSSTGAAVLLVAGRAHIDDAGLAVGIFLEPDDLGERAQRVAGIDRAAEIAAGVAEIGDGIERDVRHGLAEHDVEDEQVVDRRARIADRLGERVRRLHREARAEQAVVERDIAAR